MKLTRGSLVVRIGAVLLAISLVALINIAASLWVSEVTRGDASAINIAGSLRMQGFRVLSTLQRYHVDPTDQLVEEVYKELGSFDQRLHRSVLVNAIPKEEGHPLRKQFQQVVNNWERNLKPHILDVIQDDTVDPLLMRQSVQSLVDQVDAMVRLLEERTESKIQVLGLIQGLSLAFTVIVVLFALYDMRVNVVVPFRRLMDMAQAVSRGDFSQRSHFRGLDELSRLGATLDQMADELAKIYGSLEQRVHDKTRELERSHEALQFLHEASRSLYSANDLCEGALPLLKRLETLLEVGPIRLYLHDKESGEPFEALATMRQERPFYCRNHECSACLVDPKPFESAPVSDSEERRLLLPVRSGNVLLGTLEVWFRRRDDLEASARRILETLSDQIATTIALQRGMAEQQQLTLAEERAVIARELHDSLAQSLSYLKIQVTRLTRLEDMPDAGERRAEVVEELRTGLNNAYRQLRELLTTFRLKLDTPDLHTALLETVQEFSDRLEFPVKLNFDLPQRSVSPNEEIHILQIVREALANVVKHAHATEVCVNVVFESPQVVVSVTDNGVGIDENKETPHHYGRIIMRDRSSTLGGKLSVQNRTEGGVEVLLSFVPKSRYLISQAS
ncbi:histidine kinase [Marinobacteraceae bacterium S3BR75-40.1]